MASIRFARNFERHVGCPSAVVDGRTVADVFGAYFAGHPQVRSYVLDDQGGLRHHVAVFVNDSQITDRRTLTDAVELSDQIHVLQALSGG